MPQPPQTHHNHPPITPHPKTVFCLIYLYVSLILLRGHQSCCTTASMSFLPSQKSLRFLTHHRRHRQTPHTHTHHTHHHRHPRLHTHIHVTEPRSPTSLLHSPEHITVAPHVQDHNWMKDGSVCSDSSSSSEAETAASAPTPATYAEAAAASPTQPPALAIASPIHSPTHSNTYTPPVSSCQAQTIIIDNTHARKLKSSCNYNFQGFVMR